MANTLTLSDGSPTRMLWCVQRRRGNKVRYQNMLTGTWGPWVDYGEAGASNWISDDWHTRAIVKSRMRQGTRSVLKTFGEGVEKIATALKDVGATMKAITVQVDTDREAWLDSDLDTRTASLTPMKVDDIRDLYRWMCGAYDVTPQRGWTKLRRSETVELVLDTATLVRLQKAGS